MNKSTLILVIGHPASGKTTLARQIAEELHVPLLSKDGTLKEPMYDVFKPNSRQGSFDIGMAAFRIMTRIIEEQLKAGCSLVTESTFKYESDNELFAKLQHTYGFRAIQVVCSADASVLAKRFMQRIESGKRHAGHRDDDATAESVRSALEAAGPVKPFGLDGPVIRLNTNTFSPREIKRVLQDVKQAFKSRPS